MFRKAYILTYDKGLLDNFSYKDFHNQLTTAKGVHNWWHYLDTTYIIIVDSTTTAKNITDFIMEKMPNKNFFVCEIKLTNHNGWLDQAAWDWINQQTRSGIQ